MKTFFLISIAPLACFTAFAQGKIQFANDSLHMVYYNPGVGPTLGGTAVSSGNMPAGFTLVADLYMGTTSTSLSYYSTATFSSTPGLWNPVNVLASSPFLAGGSQVYVVAQIRDTGAPAEPTLNPTLPPDILAVIYGFSWLDLSQEFVFTLGIGVTYPRMYSSPDWVPGTYNLDQYGSGSRGAIAVGAPEPSSFALIVLGSLALFVFRRNDLARLRPWETADDQPRTTD